MDLKSLWSELLSIVEVDVAPMTYNTWFLPLEPIQIDDEELIISAPNTFTKKMIESRYMGDVQSYLDYILKKSIKIRIIQPGDQDYEETIKKAKESKRKKAKKDFDIEQNNKGQLFISTDVKVEVDENKLNQMLNPKYTFDTFVKGKSNELALAASMAVAKSPGSAYNPLFIYGGAGLGKTHLMQACAHEIIKKNPDAKVIYLSSEKFTNELISSLSAKSPKMNMAFRNKYRNIDVLLIDDIQFIAGKEGTQEEFFHTFNDLYGQNKQIIISSDRPPKEIKTLEERIVSRFEWGLMADIQLPDYETRVAILQAKLRQEKKDVPMEVLEYIAMNIKSNIRELEGALLTVIAYSSLMTSRPLDIDLAKTALKKVISEREKKPITLDLIQQVTANFYHIDKDDLSSKNRSRQIAYPRQIAMYLCRQLTDLSLLKIAGSFNRDHSTALHGIEKIKNDLRGNEELRNDVDNIVSQIKNQ